MATPPCEDWWFKEGNFLAIRALCQNCFAHCVIQIVVAADE